MKLLSLSKLITIVACLMAMPLALAQGAYPIKPISIVLPAAAGMGADVVARVIAEKMSRQLGQSVLIDNRPGAGGLIAANHVLAAAPDGYTLLLNASTFAIQAGLPGKITYSIQRDFAQIGGMAIFPQLLVASPKTDVASFADFILRSKKETINTGSAGIGSTSHFTMEMFKAITGVKINHVPYKGTSDMQLGLMSGDVAIGFDSLAASVPRLGPGQLKPVAVATNQRVPMLPSVPTLLELGYPAMISSSWTGLSAPAKTPVVILDRLNVELRKAVAEPDVKARIESLGAVPLDQTREQFSAFLDSELEKWARVIRESGVKMQ